MSGFASNEWCRLRVRKWGMMPRIHFLPARVGGGVVILTRATSMAEGRREVETNRNNFAMSSSWAQKYRCEPQVTPCDSSASAVRQYPTDCCRSIATFSCEIQPTLGFCRPCLFSSLPFLHSLSSIVRQSPNGIPRILPAHLFSANRSVSQEGAG